MGNHGIVIDLIQTFTSVGAAHLGVSSRDQICCISKALAQRCVACVTRLPPNPHPSAISLTGLVREEASALSTSVFLHSGKVCKSQRSR